MAGRWAGGRKKLDTFDLFQAITRAGLPHALAAAFVKSVADIRLRNVPAVHDRIADELFDTLPSGMTGADLLTSSLANLALTCSSTSPALTGRDVDVCRRATSAAGYPDGVTQAIILGMSPFVPPRHNGMIRERVRYPLDAGSIVMCDFTHLQPPEMVKERRAIVVSPRSRGGGTMVVIPVTKTETLSPDAHRFEPGSNPAFSQSEPVWALCEHTYTVRLERLTFVNVSRRPLRNARLSEADRLKVMRKLGTALRLLTPPVAGAIL